MLMSGWMVVYCYQCGANNPEGAVNCQLCNKPLVVEEPQDPVWTAFGKWLVPFFFIALGVTALVLVISWLIWAA